jgi:hypothetical protein
MGHDWGLPTAIVSDKDPKFVSDMWKGAFRKLGTDLLTIASCHPQTDGQSERTNQTVEIAIRMMLAQDPGLGWIRALPTFQGLMNNSPSPHHQRPPDSRRTSPLHFEYFNRQLKPTKVSYAPEACVLRINGNHYILYMLRRNTNGGA